MDFILIPHVLNQVEECLGHNQIQSPVEARRETDTLASEPERINLYRLLRDISNHGCILSANTRLRVDNPGHGPEAGLEADQVEAKADQHHGAVVAGAILGNKHQLLARLARGALVAGLRLWLQLIGHVVSCPGHTPPRHGTLL